MKFLRQNKKFNLKKKNEKFNLQSFYLNFFLFYKFFLLKFNFYNLFINLYLYNNNILSFYNSNSNNNILSFNIKNGKFISNLINYSNVFKYIYNFLVNHNLNLNLFEYKYLKEFLFNFNKYSNYNNYLFLINWILSFINPIFFIECSSVPKKYKKKLKKNYLYKIKYLNKSLRIKKSLRFINNFSNSLQYFKLSDRYIISYLDLLLNYKKSFIYQKKINAYKHIFKV